MGDQVIDKNADVGGDARARLLVDLPVVERRVELAGVSTAVLEGGAGPPVVLLHGPGEFAASAVGVIPDLVTTHRVVAPDLPGHGASTVAGGPLDADRVLSWLGGLIEATCPAPPVLVGHAGGGAIAARFSVAHGERVGRLVLVDSFGLTELRPAARLELALTRFLAQPSEHTYDRLMAECLFDSDGVRHKLGARWELLEAYTLDRARTPSFQTAVEVLIGEFGVAEIPAGDLERIAVPTRLIWGRYDLATPLEVAETASARFGWPLQVLDDAGDDPALDQPQAYLAALRTALG